MIHLIVGYKMNGRGRLGVESTCRKSILVLFSGLIFTSATATGAVDHIRLALVFSQPAAWAAADVAAWGAGRTPAEGRNIHVHTAALRS